MSGEKFSLSVSRKTKKKLDLYTNILKKWQSKINLISSSTVDDIWCRHIVDSAQLAQHIGDQNKTIVDFGTGAGFPGLVLAMLGFNHVHLIESDHRKCVFLKEVARQTKTRVFIHESRIEKLNPWAIDVVVSRGLAPLKSLLEYSYPFISNGHEGFFHKGAKIDLELSQALKRWVFDFNKINSITDHTGTILRVKNISKH